VMEYTFERKIVHDVLDGVKRKKVTVHSPKRLL